ncbi:hypothetical protein GC194_02950 [bacterium]|nr:hypothetical protein [bacterium]
MLLEIIGTLLSLAYVVLLQYNKVWAWPSGILGSLIMAYTFFTATQPLYMETLSYVVYAVLGLYGWYYWLKGTQQKMETPIVEWQPRTHLLVIIIFSALVFVFAKFLENTNESRPLFDSFTTLFALLGTYMQARKVLSNWWYWLVINASSVVLYLSTGFYYYAALSVLFTALSVSGYYKWLKIYHAR